MAAREKRRHGRAREACEHVRRQRDRRVRTGIHHRRQAAGLAIQILRGDNPAQLPVQTASSHLYLNVATAEKIGVSLSDDILRQALEIIR